MRNELGICVLMIAIGLFGIVSVNSWIFDREIYENELQKGTAKIVDYIEHDNYGIDDYNNRYTLYYELSSGEILKSTFDTDELPKDLSKNTIVFYNLGTKTLITYRLMNKYLTEKELSKVMNMLFITLIVSMIYIYNKLRREEKCIQTKKEKEQ